MTTKIRRFIVFVLPLFAVSVANAQRDMDQVYLAKGAPRRGVINTDGMARDKVTLDTAGVSSSIEVKDIVRISFAGEPAELNSARNAVLQKNYNQATIDLKKLEGQKIERAFIRQDIEYFKALIQARLALNEGGDRAAASKALVGFLTAAPQSYHFFEGAELLGDLAMAAGNWADAVKYYGPLAATRWPDYQMRANIAMGRALVGEKQFEQALEKFKLVAASEESTPEALRQKNLAAVGRAVCLAETGKVDEAVKSLNDLIDKNDPQDAVLFARAYNALGRCYQKQNKPKDAVLALLHTDLLFYADADAHAEALYHLSKLWADINKSDRAVAARNALRERYAGSVWAAMD